MRTLFEHLLLLEYDHDKTWAKHGEKIHKKLSDEELSDWDQEIDGPVPEHLLHANWNEGTTKGQFHYLAGEGDPTPHREYGQWIAHHYANGGIRRSEDVISRVRPALEKFHEAKKRKRLAKYGINPDINAHKGLGALEDAVSKLPQEEKEEDKPGRDEYDREEGQHWLHITPKTQKASQYYGRGSRWCTAASQHCMFNTYHKDGPLHIFIPKNPQYTGEKYQAHLESGSFMNEKDNPAKFDEVFKDRPSELLHRRVNEMVNSGDSKKAGRVPQMTDDREIHERLSKDSDPYVLGQVAQHTPYHDIQQKLSDHPDHGVRSKLSTNVRMNPDLETKLMHDRWPSVRGNISYRSKNPEVHRHLANDESEAVRENLIYNKHAEHVHGQVASKLNAQNQMFLAASPNAGKSVHSTLVDSQHVDVRRRLANSTPFPEVQNKLSKDEDVGVRHALLHSLREYHWPGAREAFENFAKDEDPWVRKRMAIEHRQIHHITARDPDSEVRAATLRNTQDRGVLETLAGDQHQEIAKQAQHALHFKWYEE